MFASSLTRMAFDSFMWLSFLSSSSCGDNFYSSPVCRLLHVLGDAPQFLRLVQLDLALFY